MSEFDTEEQEILDAFEAGKLKRVPDADEQMAGHRVVAEATLKKDTQNNMLKILLISLAVIFPLLIVSGYALFLLYATAPVSTFSIDKAGQFGDSFGVITCLFSGFAFSGVLVTLYFQREEMKRSENEHTQNTRLTALAALLSIYHEIADKKSADFDKYQYPQILGDTGLARDALKRELDAIYKTRNTIYSELEKAAGLK
jgi:hypothetical protein